MAKVLRAKHAVGLAMPAFLSLGGGEGLLVGESAPKRPEKRRCGIRGSRRERTWFGPQYSTSSEQVVTDELG